MTFDCIKTVAVVGAGTMGQGIAQVCASAGYAVLLYDVNAALITKGISAIHKNLGSLVQKGKLTLAHQEIILGSIQPVTDFGILKADLVIEAAVERLDEKQKIFSALENQNAKDCILVTNTSSLSITQIASSLKFADRFAGLHFFNPAPIMKLVEVVKAASTSENTIHILRLFSQKLSKQPVLAQDSPGFIVNRVARHYYVESLKLLEDNVSDVKGIDTLMRSAGFKMGPFELMDLIGIDVNFSVTTSMYHAFHEDPKFRPSRIQQQKVDAGHFGRKTGKGFYEY
jgi:3-hydroxybutyryl-CoA dehydrogenase